MSKILLIDDDLYIRDAYKEMLVSEGFEVDTAKDGKEGLEKMTAGGYDLVLLDIMLPKLDGVGILTKLQEAKAIDKNKQILILTNLAHDPAVKEAVQMGAKGVITKANTPPDKLVNYLKTGSMETPAAKEQEQPQPAATEQKAPPAHEQPAAPAEASEPAPQK